MSGGPVLVIEDHADTRRMVQEYLRFEGIPTVGAENGLEGLAVLREHRPSLILLDLSMPVMDGWHFRYEQQRLSETYLAAVPVIVLSALNDCVRQGEVLGAMDVVPKPIDFDRLLAAVRLYYRSQSD